MFWINFIHSSTKISDLDISGIFFDNVNVPALSSFVKNTNRML
ncbi:hypothetical protein RMONA_06215 [Rickettsia monacensis]|uniref:Uncharacterized protein n=1 Tax=Rickettsia monacensis TaxID=109232 RepID=A0A0B7J091_9RICK|nr:hypothetical protein [Rickettsia monacensis]CDI30070.1 hypothetical protein RMONA_7180 [Rickettsia monacensis IrR/Munich]CEO17602.1 hypothetical protein RMONA_06215 [Rickettsia monacensis]